MDKFEMHECPFCGKDVVYIGVHDDEGNYKGEIGCEYESDPWSGLSYAIHHKGWGDCLLCTDGNNGELGGILFDTPEEALAAWNKCVKEKSTKKKFMVTQDLDYIVGHLRYGHKEMIIEADSLEEVKTMFADGDTSELDIIIDDYEIDDYSGNDNPIEITEVKE